MRFLQVLWVLLVFFLFAPVVCAQNGEPPKAVKSLRTDLNGDGKPEDISLTIRGMSEIKGRMPITLTLTVSGKSVSGKFADYVERSEGFTVAQFDDTKPGKIIRIVGHAANDYAQTFLYEFTGGTLRLLGTIDTELEIPGNGAIYGEHWMGFWTRHEKYTIDATTHRLIRISQAAYYVGVKAEARESFAVRRDHDPRSPIVATTTPKSEIELLLCWYPPGDSAADPNRGTLDQGWYLIRTSRGLVGWARFDTFREKVSNLPFAG